MYYTLFFVVLPCAAVWKLYQLSRTPESRPLRWLTLCLSCAAASMAMPGSTPTLDAAFGTGTAKLLLNVLTLGMTCCLMVFYLYAVGEGPATRRRARREATVLLVVCGALTADAVTAPDDAVLRSTFESADMTVPQVGAFYGTVGLYMLYTLVVSGCRTRRYAHLSHGSAAVGLWTATAGLVGMVVSTGCRTGFVAHRAAGGGVPHWLTVATGTLLLFSTPVFVLGVTWPGARSRAAAWRLWLRHRRAYRELEPLWRLLSAAFPGTVLPETARRGGPVHRRYARRVVECRDGLVRIGPHLGGGNVEPPSAGELAVRLRRAAAAVRGGRAESRPVAPLAVPWLGDRGAEVEELVALSRALRALPGGA
ncbi:MAB_1171c family putative transporter [Streptomyces sp. PmtG]